MALQFSHDQIALAYPSLRLKSQNQRLLSMLAASTITKIVDFNIYNSTIGAGDSFIAGILFGLLCHYDEWEWARKLRFANEIAGRKVVQEGFQGLGLAMVHQIT
jgi:fructose-1-phosphate kinase PfkB-like protein